MSESSPSDCAVGFCALGVAKSHQRPLPAVAAACCPSRRVQLRVSVRPGQPRRRTLSADGAAKSTNTQRPPPQPLQPASIHVRLLHVRDRPGRPRRQTLSAVGIAKSTNTRCLRRSRPSRLARVQPCTFIYLLLLFFFFFKKKILSLFIPCRRLV